MAMTSAPKPRKRAVNLSIDSATLEQARNAGLNLSQILDEGIHRALAMRAAQDWQDENREAIESYNRRIKRRGSFGDRARRF